MRVEHILTPEMHGPPRQVPACSLQVGQVFRYGGVTCFETAHGSIVLCTGCAVLVDDDDLVEVVRAKVVVLGPEAGDE